MAPGVDELTGGLAFRGTDIATLPSEQVGASPMKVCELLVHVRQFRAAVGWDGGGNGSLFGLEAR